MSGTVLMALLAMYYLGCPIWENALGARGFERDFQKDVLSPSSAFIKSHLQRCVSAGPVCSASI